MRITSDWHIHSRNSCDGASMEVEALVREAAARGVTDYGLTDHLHTPFNLGDLEHSRADFLRCRDTPRFHFGVEVSCVSRWELDEIAGGDHGSPTYGLRRGGPPGCELAIGIEADQLDELGVEYVVGGTHWPLYVPFERKAIIQDYHRQNMFLATHPLVDIVQADQSRTDFFRTCGLDSDRPLIGLLPGSRRKEIEMILPAMVKALPRLRSKLNFQVVIAKAATIGADEIQRILDKEKEDLVEVEGS